MARVTDVATQAAIANLGNLNIAETASVLTPVSASVTSVVLVTANSSRKGLIFVNDSSAYAYISFAAVSTTTVWTHKMGPNSFWSPELPCFQGTISCIWSAATGQMQVTELS